MTLRYLFGPVTAAFADQNLHLARRSGECRTFNHTGDTDLTVGPADTFEAILSRCPAGWRPDFIVVRLDYTTVPECLWSAPMPLVGLAGDWNLLFHHYRLRLPCCDLVLTDALGVEALARQGLTHARAANLFGCERAYLEGPWPDGSRDIDILFVGNLHPAVQRERMPWLARLAALAGRWKVAIRTGVFGQEYRALLARSRVVFNRSIRGECNLRAFEAAAAGALLLQESGNREVSAYFRDRKECIFYAEDDLEELLDFYLTHEGERRAVAEAAWSLVREYGFESLWRQALRTVADEWSLVQERARQRPGLPGEEQLLARTWQALCSSQGADPMLARDLAETVAAQPRSAELHNALGLAATLATRGQRPTLGAAAEQATPHFQRALTADPEHLVALLNHVECLTAVRQHQPAIEQARRLLSLLDRGRGLDPRALGAVHFPPEFDHFRVEWERAAWQHAGRPRAEARVKGELLRWRAHALLADLTGDLVHYHEAALACPDLPPTRAALGCALGRAGRPAEALSHLRAAVAGNPLDAQAVRAFYQALLDSGDAESAVRLAHDRRLLHAAAPQVVAAEPWFWTAAPVPPGTPSMVTEQLEAPIVVTAGPGAPRPRVSLSMIVKDEEHNLPACLDSVRDLVDEVVIADTGSVDRTREVAARYGARVVDFPWIDSFAAARNESLRHATGDYVLWLDADDQLDEPNRQRLLALLTGLSGDNVAWVMKCLCLTADGGPGTIVDHVRLFPNHPAVRWEHRVHEQVLPALRRHGCAVRWSDVVIHHTGYRDPALRGQKLERDLRLLHLEDADRPDHPFTLFNLGSIHAELGRPEQALPLLRRSLERSAPRDSIVRKLYALIVQCHRARGQAGEALAAVREGREGYPDDPELLFAEGVLLHERGDLPGATACFERVLGSRPGEHFASVDAGLTGYKARYNLGLVYARQGRRAEAETLWRQAVAERPDFVPGWVELGHSQLNRQDWGGVEETARRLEAIPGGAAEAARLRAARSWT
jgi:tetratricopeptide (TPR) repeat protein